MQVKLTKTPPVSVLGPQWADTNVATFLPIKARELKFCVCVISVGNPHLWPIFNPFGPLEAELVFLTFYLQGVIVHSAPPPTVSALSYIFCDVF